MRSKLFLCPMAILAAFFLLAACGEKTPSELDCDPPCDVDECYECVDGECVPACDEGLICDGEGNCVECHPACDVEACFDCVDGECVYLCGEGEECDGDGTCVPRQPGQANLLELSMHDGLTRIYLTDMTVTDEDVDDYDLYVSHLDGPTFELGYHVEALNLGNELGFHEIEELPEDGYEPDGDGVDGLIIGTDYRTGGEGSTGFDMSEDVYALKLDFGDDDVTYAKIQVLQAMAGEVHVLAYWQEDGSRYVGTEE